MSLPLELAPARFFDARRVTVPASGTFPIRYDFQPDVIKFLAYSSIENRIEIVLSGSQGGGSIPIFGRGPVDIPGVSENQEILLRNLDTTNRDLLVIAMKGYLPVQFNTPEVTTSVSHILLDGNVHSDTVVRAPLEGDVIIGTDVAGSIFWQALPAGGNFEVLEKQVNGSVTWQPPNIRAIANLELSADAASIDFENISTAYKQLLLVGSLRAADAVTSRELRMRINNDSGVNYDFLYSQVSHSAALVTAEGIGFTYIEIGTIPGESSPANMFGSMEVKLPDYQNTIKNSTVHFESYAEKVGTTGNLVRRSGGGTWINTSVINRITVFASSGDLLAGSQLNLYGLGV